MDSQIHALTEMGRMRREADIARADHYRLVQIAKRRSQRLEDEAPLSRAWVIVFRRALKVAALSVVMATSAIVVL
jgi:hypothetical protein